MKRLANTCAQVALLLSGVLPALLAAQESETQAVTGYRDRYVTEFQRHRRLVYEPQVSVAATSTVRGGWNPWGKRALTQVRVPVVRWVPRWHEQSVPITRRERVPTRRLVQVSETPRAGQRAGSPAPLTQTFDRTRRSEVGGVARLEEGFPRVGAALEGVRR